jgi:mono/diheme cytochrome c family protein
MLRVIIHTCSVILLAFGCKAYDLGDEEAFAVAVDKESPTWENGIGELITRKCASCHTADRDTYVPTNTPHTFDDLHKQEFVETNAFSIQSYVFDNETTPMPPSFATQLTADEKSALEAYLTPLVTTIESMCGETKEVATTYAATEALITRDCASCHASEFSSLDKVKSSRRAMITYIHNGSMPQGNPTYKDSADGTTMFEWLCFGADVQ